MKKVISICIRTLFVIVSFLFFLMFFIPIISGIRHIGSVTGSLLCVWLFCVSVKPIYVRIKAFMYNNIFTKMLFRVGNICITAFLIYGLTVTGFMIYFACQPPAENATAVVLGAQIKDSGPSVMLWGRINSAEKYLESNENVSAVLSGGQGDDEPMSEAQAMKNILEDKGIETQRLYMEDKSTNTTENMKFSMQIIEENNLNNDLAVVTDSFHQLRVRIIARQLGIEGEIGSINSDTRFIYLPTFAVREWIAIPNQILFR